MSIKENERNKTNIFLIENLLEAIKELRNNFIHFPFYYEHDYRFDYMYFQLMAYLIEGNNLWDLIGNEVKIYIQNTSQAKPTGIDLLGGIKLYETKN